MLGPIVSTSLLFLRRHLKEIGKKGNNSAKITTFFFPKNKHGSLDNHIRNIISESQSLVTRINQGDKYDGQIGKTKIWPLFVKIF